MPIISETMRLAEQSIAGGVDAPMPSRSPVSSGATFELAATPAGSVRLSISGDTEFINALKQLHVRTLNAIGRDVLSEANEIVTQEILSRVPVRSGKLKAGIGKTSGRRQKNRISNVVYMPVREDLGIDAKDPYYYPAVLEFGRRARRSGKFRRRRSRLRDLLDQKVWQGKPFMRPGYDAAEPQVISFIQTELPKRLVAAWQNEH